MLQPWFVAHHPPVTQATVTQTSSVKPMQMDHILTLLKSIINVSMETSLLMATLQKMLFVLHLDTGMKLISPVHVCLYA